MEGRSYMHSLKSRAAKTDPCGTPFFRFRNLLGLLSPVVKVKFLFRTGSMIIPTMCLSGRSLSCLQVRPCARQCHTQLSDRQTWHQPFLCLKRILNVLRKHNNLVYGRLSVSKSSLLLWEKGVDHWSDAIVDQSFKGLVRDAEQRDGTVALRVLHRF